MYPMHQRGSMYVCKCMLRFQCPQALCTHTCTHSQTLSGLSQSPVSLGHQALSVCRVWLAGVLRRTQAGRGISPQKGLGTKYGWPVFQRAMCNPAHTRASGSSWAGMRHRWEFGFNPQGLGTPGSPGADRAEQGDQLTHVVVIHHCPETRQGLSSSHLLFYPGHVLGEVAHLPGQETLACLQKRRSELAEVPAAPSTTPCLMPLTRLPFGTHCEGAAGEACGRGPVPLWFCISPCLPHPAHILKDVVGQCWQFCF